jgi:hypothetical protein
MHWQFRYPKRNTFYPPDHENPGLGGCEASLVLLTRALAACGHRVEVFNCCYRPGAYDGVRRRMAWELSDAEVPDVAVAVRFEEAIWPAIRTQAPDAELWVTSGRHLCGYTNSEAEDRWKQTIGAGPLPEGVELLGTLPRTELIDIQQRGYLTLYPCRFPEMFCLAAAESAAAGTPLITSASDALGERVTHGETGILVPGVIDHPRVRDAFTAGTTALLADSRRRETLAAAAQASVRDLEPDTVAARWETLAM